MTPGDANLVGTWCLVGRACEGEVDDDGEVALVATGSALSFFNLALVQRRPVDAEATATRIERFFGERSLEYMVWVDEAHCDVLLQPLLARGLVGVGEAPGMERPSSGESPEPPPGLDIRQVHGLDDYDLYMTVLANGFGVPLDLAAEVFRPALFERTGAVALMGCVDGEPVCTSAMVPGGGVAGIYNVATPEPFRRKGYGEALTWAAVEAGREAGFSTSVLQASTMGRPIYERMGFTTYATYRQLSPA